MDWLKLETSTELIKLASDDIIGVIGNGNYSDIITINGKHTLTYQLHVFEEALSQMDSKTFVRVGKSLIVNKKYICYINLTSKTLILSSGALKKDHIFTASREALAALKTLINK